MQPSNQEETSRRGDEKGGYGRGESKRRELAKLGEREGGRSVVEPSF